MNDVTISAIVLLTVFGGALLGMFLRSILPQDHLGGDAKDTVRVGIGLVLTITAMVLSLLIASAKSYFDTQSSELTDMAAKAAVLDRILAHYGPQANEARGELREIVVRMLDRMWSKQQGGGLPGPGTNEALYDKLQGLSPQNDAQRSMQAQALSVSLALAQTRWLMYEQGAGGVATPLLLVMVFWLAIAFTSFGLFSPRNLTVAIGLFLCALAASGAVFMILEMYSPFTGLIHISDAPLRAALAHLSQ